MVAEFWRSDELTGNPTLVDDGYAVKLFWRSDELTGNPTGKDHNPATPQMIEARKRAHADLTDPFFLK